MKTLRQVSMVLFLMVMILLIALEGIMARGEQCKNNTECPKEEFCPIIGKGALTCQDRAGFQEKCTSGDLETKPCLEGFICKSPKKNSGSVCLVATECQDDSACVKDTEYCQLTAAGPNQPNNQNKCQNRAGPDGKCSASKPCTKGYKCSKTGSCKRGG